ncbi:hypothetical protein GSI_08942 [Ganoderma sinense ZZ0214-1]|uniref:RNase III domain-containing protein n=1 Tax=Ganoderma sinense ZZ0214-1 TaxID=1077348 RepID=A0A2G8S539_9APHY|nr:hypothetical protein GSI_08942 [Ganoderma sinense ZZ0214-1]
MSRSWECALALRRAASCRRQMSIPMDPKQITPRPELLPRRSTEQWNKQDDVLVQHLNNIFSPLQFPPELASRILTHASHPDATRRHNARLSFVGRRVLQSYLLMFIHSSPALRPDHDFEKFISHALNTYTLGELVAPKWELGKVTKWKPMNVGSLSRPLGPDDDIPSPFADVKADNARSIEGSMQGLHAGFHEHALEVCEKMGGRTGPLLR